MKNIMLKILVLEDSFLDMELIRELLTDAGYTLDLTHVVNEAEFTEKLSQNCYDIILSDFNLPGFDAFGALEISKKFCPEVPFICVSGSIGEDTAIELLKLGTVDYVLKDRPERLPFAVKRALEEAKEKAEHQKAEERIKLLDRAIEASTISVCITDVEGKIIYVNPFFCSLSGYSQDEMLGKTTRFLHSGLLPEKFYEEIWATVLSGKDWEGETQNKKKNGDLFWAKTYISPIINEQGNISHFVRIKEDITERKKMMEDLVIAKEKAEENDKLKTAFINNISHEIRTPLNGILGFGHFLADEKLSPDKRKEYYKIVRESGNRLMNTVTDYMDMAMIVTGTMRANKKEFAIKPLFEEIIEDIKPLQTGKNIRFVTEIPKEHADLIIKSDSKFIRKIFNILLSNAYKFTKNGIIVSGYRILSENIEFFVQDTGSGISPEKLDLIFDIFTQEETSDTRGYEGSGLGLTIAKGLVNLLGGILTVVSEKGKGSTFTCSIPLDGSGIKTSPLTARKLNRATGSNKPLVLIVEDDDLNLLYMKSVLGIIGCDSIQAINGAEAVEICKHNSDISIVLMDIRMPVMNGVEATKLIREFKPELPIIATTAYALSGDEHRLLETGITDYLAKPINKEKLIEILRKYN
ncbi:MAG: response regulator [Paludibacter sp.]|nr:response regulator [Paludibacter sp.]